MYVLESRSESDDGSEDRSSGQAEAGADALTGANDDGAALRGAQRAGAGGHVGRDADVGVAGGGNDVAAAVVVVVATIGVAGGSRGLAGDGNDVDAAGGAGGEVDLRHGHAGVDDDGAARVGDLLAGLVGARNNGGDVDDDGGIDGGDGGRGSDGDVGGNGGVGGDAGVGVHPLAADTLEVGDGLGDDGVGLTVGVEAVVDVLDELGVRAVARGVGVVGAANEEHEGVQAGRDDVGAGEGLDGLDRAGDAGGVAAAGHRGGGRASRGSRADSARSSVGLNAGQGLGHRANSSRDSDSDDSGDNRVGRAVGDRRLARRDGLGARGEDGRGAVEAGGDGLGDDGSSLGGRLGGGAVTANGDRGTAVTSANWNGSAADLLSSGGSGSRRDSVLAGFTGRSARLGALHVRGSGGLGSSSGDVGSLGRLRGLSCLGRLRAGSSAAVEGDGGDLDGAAGLGLVGLGRVNDGDVLGATALFVVDSRARLLARAAMLAQRAIRHVVVELEITVKLGLDMDRP